jgi:Na+-driven multidrug efflux pump
MLAGFAVVELFPSFLLGLFSRDSAGLLAIGVPALRICMAALPIVGFQVVAATYFQAVGRPRESMLLMLSRQVLLLIPAILVLPRFWGLHGIYYAVPLSDLGSALLTGVCLAIELRHLERRHTETQQAGAAAQAPAPLPLPQEQPAE